GTNQGRLTQVPSSTATRLRRKQKASEIPSTVCRPRKGENPKKTPIAKARATRSGVSGNRARRAVNWVSFSRTRVKMLEPSRQRLLLALLPEDQRRPWGKCPNPGHGDLGEAVNCQKTSE